MLAGPRLNVGLGMLAAERRNVGFFAYGVDRARAQRRLNVGFCYGVRALSPSTHALTQACVACFWTLCGRDAAGPGGCGAVDMGVDMLIFSGFPLQAA